MNSREKVINQLKDKYLNTRPVPLNTIAKDCGISITVRYMGSLSGKIMKTDRGYEITVNNYHPHTRMRFTIAHELAHFFLHKKNIGDGIIDDPMYRSTLSNTKEIEANRLAADIIMPLHKVKERVEHYKSIGQDFDNTLAHNLAEEFDVSLGSMKIRLGL